jgi:hypothetical protein
MAQLSLSAPKKEDKAATKSNPSNKKKNLKDKYPEWRFKCNGSEDKMTRDGKTFWCMQTWMTDHPSTLIPFPSRLMQGHPSV